MNTSANNSIIQVPIQPYYSRKAVSNMTNWSLGHITNLRPKGLKFQHHNMIRADELFSFLEGRPIKMEFVGMAV